MHRKGRLSGKVRMPVQLCGLTRGRGGDGEPAARPREPAGVDGSHTFRNMQPHAQVWTPVTCRTQARASQEDREAPQDHSFDDGPCYMCTHEGKQESRCAQTQKWRRPRRWASTRGENRGRSPRLSRTRRTNTPSRRPAAQREAINAACCKVYI